MKKPPTELCPRCGKPGYKRPPMGRRPTLDDAKVLKLKEVDGWTGKAIAEHYGVHESAVWQSLARSRAKK